MYEYLSHLKKVHAPPTRAASMLQAWAFCVHAFGFPDLDRTCLSIRCRGSSHRQYLQKRRLRRKLPIPMVLLGLLEMAACHLAVNELRAQAGFICFLAHSRLRNHEGNLVITWDANASKKRLFLEGNLAGNKTGKSKEKKASFLPLVTPLRGVATDEWFPSFVLARERLGLDSLPSEWDGASCAEVPLVLPSPRDPLKAISSDEVSGALRAILRGLEVPNGDSACLTSHSCKTTWLTALGKAGADLRSRQLLGFHVPRGETSALNYCADNLAGPIQTMDDCLRAVAAGEFMPDAPRQLMWPESEAIPLRQQIEQYLNKSLEDIVEAMRGDTFIKLALGDEGLSEEEQVVDAQTNGPPVLPILCSNVAQGCNEEENQVESPQATPSIGLGEENEFGSESCGPASPVGPHLELAGPSPLQVPECPSVEVLAEGSSESSESEDSCAEQAGPSTPRPALSEELVNQITAEAEQAVPCKTPASADVKVLLVHRTRKTLHYGHIEKSHLLGCKSPKTPMHIHFEGCSKSHFPKCKWCF
jgi:hypothetical protein